MTDACSFRLDDITPDMDWNKFYRVKAIFDKYKVRPLIGVVPQNADPTLSRGEYHDDFWEYIASLARNGWMIAQHGFRHVYETSSGGLLGLKQASEFAGLPYETQYEKLKSGREILQKHGLDVTIFMAPGHTYDGNTLKALKSLGFTCVSDGYTDVPYYAKGLLFIPCRSSRPVLLGGVDTICLHCNELEERDYRELEIFLERRASSVYPFSEFTGQLWYPNRTPALWMQEKRNLLRRSAGIRLAGSETAQRYLRETYDENPSVKRKKRIQGLPGLLFGSLIRRR